MREVLYKLPTRRPPHRNLHIVHPYLSNIVVFVIENQYYMSLNMLKQSNWSMNNTDMDHEYNPISVFPVANQLFPSMYYN